MQYKITYTKEPQREFGPIESWHKNTGISVVTVDGESEQDALSKAHKCVNREHMRYYSIEAL